MMPVKQLPKRGPSRTQVLALAMATGTAAALLAYVGLARQTQGARTETRSVFVVTATRALPPRTLLVAAMLRAEPIPITEAPAGALHLPAALVGQVTTEEVAAGRPLTSASVTTRGGTAGIAPQIAPDRRAVSIPLDAAGGAAGFLEPGDHVDVLATFDAGGGQSIARLVVPDARLLALGARTSGATTPATSATLEVTPRAAQALALAAARGRLTLALRGLGDNATPPLPALPSAAVTGLPAPKPPPPMPAPVLPVQALKPLPVAPPPPPAPPQVTVVRGTQKTTVTVGE